MPPASRRRGHARGRGKLGAAGLNSEKEEAAEAASAYVIDIPSFGASLHKCPTDHIDRAYKRRPEQSNPAGRDHRQSSCSSRDIRDGGDRNTNLRMREARREYQWRRRRLTPPRFSL